MCPLRLAHKSTSADVGREKVRFKQPASEHTTLLIEKDEEKYEEDCQQTESMLQFQELSLDGSQIWVMAN